MSQHDLPSTAATTAQNARLSTRLNALSSAKVTALWHYLRESGAISGDIAVTAAGILAALTREQVQAVEANFGRIT